MKKGWIIAFVTVFVISIAGVAVFDGIFPKAKPISFPSAENITSFCVKEKNSASTAIPKADWERFLAEMRTVRPTRKMSVNDTPAVKNFYTIDISAAGQLYRYYVYRENSQVYVEIPYEGVYRADGKFFRFVGEYFLAATEGER